MIKLWYPSNLFDANYRNGWFELIKSRQRYEQDKREIDANIQQCIQWVDTENKADVLVLPQHWNYYYERNQQKLAISFCQEASLKGKKVLSFSGGDQGISPPVPENTTIYRQSGYRSKQKPNERTIPFFLSDPISVFLGLEESDVLLDKPFSQPIVGFCGMAPHGLQTELKERAQIMFRNAKSFLSLSHGDLQEVMSSSNTRFKTLEIFQNSSDFKTNYIIRQKYRGGVQTPENRKKTTEEYYQNQIDSDLVVCVRGVGNFSLRFYETLAMGRIPIFIDTDSPLPDISPFNWHDYIIWVDRKEIKSAPEIAKQWLQNRDIREQQKKNRALWVSHFRGDNFWIRELERLESSLIKNE